MPAEASIETAASEAAALACDEHRASDLKRGGHLTLTARPMRNHVMSDVRRGLRAVTRRHG